MKFNYYYISELQKEKFRKKVLDKESSRHHYIPQFLTYGFAKNKKVYVFDKELGKILPKMYSIKSVFYNQELNTIEVNGAQTTYLEDVFYKIIDDSDSQIVRYMRDSNLEKLQLINNLQTQFFYFVLNLLK